MTTTPGASTPDDGVGGASETPDEIWHPRTFEAFVRQYGERIYYYARGHHSNTEDALDATQETFKAMAKNWEPTYQWFEESHLKASAFTIVRNKIVDVKRRGGRLAELATKLASELHIKPTAANPFNLIDHELSVDIWQHVRQAVTPKQFEVLSLYFVADLTEQQIADALHIQRGTVSSIKTRAVEKIQEHFAKHGLTADILRSES